MSLKNDVLLAFEARFGNSASALVRAPGRVNVIGEHTDYNDGFVLPMAINREIWIALRPREDAQVLLHSLDFPRPARFSLHGLQRGEEGWIEYVKGVAWSAQQAGLQLHGWEGVVAGDVPVGAGLSSSAALELAVLSAFSAISPFAWEPARMAALAQKAENEWVGLQCGIMDQMISAVGQKGHAVLIDCQSLGIKPVPLPTGTVVVVLDTATRRGLVDSAYNERREQCEQASRHFGASTLREVSRDTFLLRSAELDPVVRARARHVITENERTLEAAKAMRDDDPTRLGALMNASHDSLRDDFEVTNQALNAIVEISRRQDGCFGSRMTGAGFGGCAVALVAIDAIDAFVDSVSLQYLREIGLQAQVYICEAVDGATIERA